MILLMMKAYSMLYLMISFALQSTENLRWFLATPIALMVLRNKSFTKVSLLFLLAKIFFEPVRTSEFPELIRMLQAPPPAEG